MRERENTMTDKNLDESKPAHTHTHYTSQVNCLNKQQHPPPNKQTSRYLTGILFIYTQVIGLTEDRDAVKGSYSEFKFLAMLHSGAALGI